MTGGKCRDASPEQDRLNDSWAATGEDWPKDAGAAAEEEGPLEELSRRVKRHTPRQRCRKRQRR